MKRYSLMTGLLVFLLAAALASPCLAVYPKPDTTVTVNLQQGWYDGRVAWYVCTDTSSISFAKTLPFPY